jgi:Ni/Co efflux regulator RcnB
MALPHSSNASWPLAFRWRRLAFALLLVATAAVGAESPTPEPIAPAVIGRPLDEIRPYRPVRPKPAAAKPSRPKQIAASSKPAPAAPVAAAPAAAAAVAAAPAATTPPAPQAHAPKQAIDDRVDRQARVVDNVGQGTVVARKSLAPGAFLGSKYQEMVRRYYQAHPAPARAASWKIGEPVPPRATLSGVPDQVRAALPKVPPGHQYVQLDGEVVLIAVQSRMVVDGVSRTER